MYADINQHKKPIQHFQANSMVPQKEKQGGGEWRGRDFMQATSSVMHFFFLKLKEEERELAFIEYSYALNTLLRLSYVLMHLIPRIHYNYSQKTSFMKARQHFQLSEPCHPYPNCSTRLRSLEGATDFM